MGFSETINASVIAGVVLLVIGALNYKRFFRWCRSLFVPNAPRTHFTILLCDLIGDENGNQTHHVAEAFLGQIGLQVLRLGKVLEMEDIGLLSDIQENIVNTGREWLKRKNAHLLIWGKVSEADKVMKLWFLRQEGQSTLGAEPYILENTQLPLNFHQDLAAQIVGVSLASIAPVTENSGTYLVELLMPVAEKLEHLLKNPLPSFSPIQQADLQHCFALTAGIIGEQTGEEQWLNDAVAACREALKEWTQDRVPLDWAMTQNNLGNALTSLGERENNVEFFENAKSCIQAAELVYKSAGYFHHKEYFKSRLDSLDQLIEALK